MRVEYTLDEGAFVPTKAHRDDAGFDLRTPKAVTVYAHSSVSIDTGFHVAIPSGYCGFLKSKSGLNVNFDLVNEGVIDCGYTGSIVVHLYNHGDEDYYFQAGDKISQLVILETPYVEFIQLVELYKTERGDNGFGSTGR